MCIYIYITLKPKNEMPICNLNSRCLTNCTSHCILYVTLDILFIFRLFLFIVRPAVSKFVEILILFQVIVASRNCGQFKFT
jgi:hypothetical protein